MYRAYLIHLGCLISGLVGAVAVYVLRDASNLVMIPVTIVISFVTFVCYCIVIVWLDRH